MILYWILWVIDAVVALIIFYFFIIGINDGSIGSSNGGLWTAILIGLLIILGGSYYLKDEYQRYAKILLATLAIPSLLYGLIILIFILSKGRWN